MLGRDPDEDVIKRYEAKFETTLEAYERILSKQKYIGGNVRVSTLSRSNADVALHRISRLLTISTFPMVPWLTRSDTFHQHPFFMS